MSFEQLCTLSQVGVGETCKNPCSGSTRVAEILFARALLLWLPTFTVIRVRYPVGALSDAVSPQSSFFSGVAPCDVVAGGGGVGP